MRRTSRGAFLLAALFAAGCGSDPIMGPDDTPEPVVSPVTATFSGNYTLSLTPDPLCGLPAGPHAVAVVASTSSGARPEVRVTLPGNDTRLAAEMLFPEPGRVRGSIGTTSAVRFQSGFELHVRAVGDAVLSRAADGRAEVTDGSLVGDIEVTVTPAAVAACSSVRHRFALRAR